MHTNQIKLLPGRSRGPLRPSRVTHQRRSTGWLVNILNVLLVWQARASERYRLALQEILHVLDADVQVVVVAAAAEEVQLADEARSDSLAAVPVLLEIVPQVVVLEPVLRDRRVDLARELVEHRFEIAV